jgi:hypothetical protein
MMPVQYKMPSVTSPPGDEEEHMEVDTAEVATSHRGITNPHSSLFSFGDHSSIE